MPRSRHRESEPIPSGLRARRPSERSGRLPGALLVALLLASGSGWGGEIYRYTDDRGRLHFTEDLSKVPPRYREQARAAGWDGHPSRYQRIASDPPPETVPGGGQPPPAGLGPGAGARPRAVRVRVRRAGAGMLVRVRLDGRVEAPFLIDTGASDVVIPASVARELGLTGSGRTQVYRTANGLVEQPVVRLRSVDLGGAVARDVPASVSPSMEVGLLGLSFFNRFTYQIDAAAGVVTLIPNDLEARGLIRGGRSEAQWRAEYRNLHARLRAVAEERARTPSSRGRKLRELDRTEEELRQQLAVLDAEADRARVPMAWRDDGGGTG